MTRGQILMAPDGVDGAGAAAGGDKTREPLVKVDAADGKTADKTADGKTGVERDAYWPKLPAAFETYKGKTDQETIDKLSTRVVKLGVVPEKADGYTPKFDETFVKRFGTLEKDPALAVFRDVAFKHDIGGEAFGPIIADFFQAMVDKNLIDAPVSPEEEYAKLGKQSSDPARRVAEGAERVMALNDTIKAQVKAGTLTQQQANLLAKQTFQAVYVEALEAFAKGFTSTGIKAGGEAAPLLSKDQVYERLNDPRMKKGTKGYDPKFVAETNRLFDALHGRKTG